MNTDKYEEFPGLHGCSRQEAHNFNGRFLKEVTGGLKLIVRIGGREGESHALRFTKGPALSWSLPKHEGNPFPQTPFGSIASHEKKAGQV
jgi:hypothetical protein